MKEKLFDILELLFALLLFLVVLTAFLMFWIGIPVIVILMLWTCYRVYEDWLFLFFIINIVVLYIPSILCVLFGKNEK